VQAGIQATRTYLTLDSRLHGNDKLGPLALWLKLDPVNLFKT